jgi:hypothetical protein
MLLKDLLYGNLVSESYDNRGIDEPLTEQRGELELRDTLHMLEVI